jgi:antitoxin StbD
MASVILADTAASISDLKKNPMSVVAQGEGFPVAILNRNRPAFYCVPAEVYEELMDKLEDIELNTIANSRIGQKRTRITLDEL